MSCYDKCSEIEVRNAFAAAHCLSEVSRLLGFSPNGTTGRILKSWISKFNIDTSHFDRLKKNRRWERIEKTCPVCSKAFSTAKNHPREKTTCSHKCSNTYFRSGDNNGARMKKLRQIEEGEREFTYSEVCWQHHKYECVICGENVVVAAHHYNGDHNDNQPENFVPLCPTHHQYWHSRHRHLIQERIDLYVKAFKI